MLRHAQIALKFYFTDLRYRNALLLIIIIIIIIIIIFIIVVVVVVELIHSKTILETTVKTGPQPAALHFKNLSQYSSHSK